MLITKGQGQGCTKQLQRILPLKCPPVRAQCPLPCRDSLLEPRSSMFIKLLHILCPERPLGVGGGNQLSPRSSQFPSQFHPSPVKIHLLQEALRLDGARLPSRGLQASHTADYLLHFHLSAVVLCLSFLVSDFPSLFALLRDSSTLHSKFSTEIFISSHIVLISESS